MIQIKNKEEIIGKTIKKIAFGGSEEKCFIFLNNDEFFILEANHFEDYSEICFQSWNFEIKPNIFNSNELYNLGFITKEHSEEIRLDYESNNIKKLEEQEIEQLKKLKEKYPNI